MRTTSIVIFLGSLLAAQVSAAGERFWTNSKDGRFQACFREGHDWYFCTTALAGTWSSYKSKLPLGDGYFVQFSENGMANIGSDNGCFKAHCLPKYDSEADKRMCDVITDSANC